MCVVSFVGDHFNRQWPAQPIGIGQPAETTPGAGGQSGFSTFQIGPTRYEFDELKKEVLEMKELLKKAKEIDEKTNQPDCEMEEKMKVLRAVAKMVGVDLNDVIPEKK